MPPKKQATPAPKQRKSNLTQAPSTRRTTRSSARERARTPPPPPPPPPTPSQQPQPQPPQPPQPPTISTMSPKPVPAREAFPAHRQLVPMAGLPSDDGLPLFDFAPLPANAFDGIDFSLPLSQAHAEIDRLFDEQDAQPAHTSYLEKPDLYSSLRSSITYEKSFPKEKEKEVANTGNGKNLTASTAGVDTAMAGSSSSSANPGAGRVVASASSSSAIAGPSSNVVDLTSNNEHPAKRVKHTACNHCLVNALSCAPSDDPNDDRCNNCSLLPPEHACVTARMGPQPRSHAQAQAQAQAQDKTPVTISSRCDFCYNTHHGCVKENGNASCAACVKREIVCTMDVLRDKKVGALAHVAEVKRMMKEGKLRMDGTLVDNAGVGTSYSTDGSAKKVAPTGFGDVDMAGVGSSTSKTSAAQVESSGASGDVNAMDLDGPMISGAEGNGFNAGLGGLGGGSGAGVGGIGNSSLMPPPPPPTPAAPTSAPPLCCPLLTENAYSLSLPFGTHQAILLNFANEFHNPGLIAPTFPIPQNPPHDIFETHMFTVGVFQTKPRGPPNKIKYYGISEAGKLSELMVTDRERLTIVVKHNVYEALEAGGVRESVLVRLNPGIDLECAVHEKEYVVYLLVLVKPGFGGVFPEY